MFPGLAMQRELVYFTTDCNKTVSFLGLCFFYNLTLYLSSSSLYLFLREMSPVAVRCSTVFTSSSLTVSIDAQQPGDGGCRARADVEHGSWEQSNDSSESKAAG